MLDAPLDVSSLSYANLLEKLRNETSISVIEQCSREITRRSEAAQMPPPNLPPPPAHAQYAQAPSFTGAELPYAQFPSTAYGRSISPPPPPSTYSYGPVAHSQHVAVPHPQHIAVPHPQDVAVPQAMPYSSAAFHNPHGDIPRAPSPYSLLAAGELPLEGYQPDLGQVRERLSQALSRVSTDTLVELAASFEPQAVDGGVGERGAGFQEQMYAPEMPSPAAHFVERY